MTDSISAHGKLAFDDVGTGLPVVLLHGSPLSREMWAPQVSALRDAYRVITPDLRGFGDSPGFTDTPSMDRMADDTAELLDDLKIAERVVLGGLSMGGYVAFAFARRHGRRLRGLLLADTKAEADDAEGKANRDRLIAFTSQHTGSDVLEQMLPKLVCPETLSRRPAVIEVVQQIGAKQKPASIIQALQAMRDRPDSVPSLAAINVPTLVVVGEMDALTPPSLAETLAARIRGAKLVRIAGAGHLANLENPAAFNAAVLSFLRSLS
jgi:pimeloyl-ACP methyl ester carboxylesterase